jgi:subfamily B ATP-binding cassette protein MsbA
LTQANQRTAAEKQSSLALMRRLLGRYVRPYTGRLLLAVLSMAVYAGATAFTAWLMKPALDNVFGQKDQTMLVIVPLALVAAVVLKGIADYGQAMLTNNAGLRIIADLQNEMFAHLMRADLAFFHNTATGNLISRFTNDVNLLRSAVSNALISMGRELLTLIALVGVMFYQDWKLALAVSFVFPLAVIPVVRLGRRIRRVSANTQAEIANLATLLSQAFQGARHVKAYGMEAYEGRRAGKIIDAVFRQTFKAARVRSIARPLMEILGFVGAAIVIYYSGGRVIASEATPGTFFSFIAAFFMAYQPMKAIGSLNSYLQEGLGAAERVFAMLDIEPQITDRAGARPLAVRGGAIRFERVAFAYSAGHPTLSNLSLEVPAGKTVALVGPSGAGKSTILNLIPRFYDVESGAVTIDGEDLREVTLASLRANLALVSQEISLFDDTVRANIAYGKWGCSEEDIVQAAKRAAAHEFIVNLPQGYDTLVGEHGIKLSGGQRQRISIARAMVKNAPILLLDEATSSLDSESERLIQAALAELMKGRTTLVIAHRLSTVIDADLIYGIEAGRVVESGTHAELLAKGGTYARLYALQFADEAAKQGRARVQIVSS